MPQSVPAVVGVRQPPVPLHVLDPVTHEKPDAFVPTHELDEQVPVPDGGYTHSEPPLQIAPQGATLLRVQSLPGADPAGFT